jgi:biotin carboxyl carrier protein
LGRVRKQAALSSTACGPSFSGGTAVAQRWREQSLNLCEFNVVFFANSSKKQYICDMLKVKVNNQKEHTIVLGNTSGGTIDGTSFEWDVIEVKNGSFHVIKDHHSYNVEVIKADPAEKSFLVSVNGNKYQLNVKDKFDELLKSLGFDNLNASKVNEIKAPMPGLVLDIRISEGDEVKKGDAILVLEAMKMENIIKSPTDGTIKKINVKKGQAVEKNQVMINFG